MLSIPIVSSFDSKGIKQAIKQFKQLETTGQKAQFALKKAAIPAAAALATVTAGLFDATKAAMEDEAAQASLARQLQRSTKATDAQIAANEDWIKTQGQLLGVTDDELRPALSGLARVTRDIGKAQKATTLAMDIAAAKGVSLSTVTKALERAYGGNLNAITKIAPEFKKMIKDGATLEQVIGELSKKFGGEAAAAADTTAGKMRRLSVAMDETKESVGEALLPALEATLPVLQDFSDWASKNPETFKNIALAIGGITAATLALNAAMAVNPYVLLAAAIVAVATAVNKLYDAAEKMNGIKGIGAKLVAGLFGAQYLLPKVISDVRGNNEQATGRTSPGAFRGFDMANVGPTIATTNNRGVVVNVNTGVGDPVAIGKQVNDVLTAYLRRGK
jgi:hypothetical protein